MARLPIVLIGLPGCGKSTAGRLAAGMLGAPFADLDELISQSAGLPMPRVFVENGEARFRELERAAMARALEAPAGVIAPGGGWAAQPGNLDPVAGRVVLIYLRVTPAMAAERLGDGAGRPLLTGKNVLTELTRLLEAREAHYRRAGHSIDTDARSPEWVAAAIAALARKHGAWEAAGAGS